MTPEVARMAHPEIRLSDPYAADVDDKIRAAIIASPTGAVRAYMLNRHGKWDTDETADILALGDHGAIECIDPGTA